FALAGEQVHIGSRRPDRAAEAAATLNARLAGSGVEHSVSGSDNATAARAAAIIAVALPFTGVEPVLTGLAPLISGKIVLDMVNPVTLNDGLFKLIPVAAGSAAELIQHLLPQAHVVSAFKNLSAHQLARINQPLEGDVLLCADAAAPKAFCASLVR